MARPPDRGFDLLLTGSGEPTTVFAHGLAGSIAETRPFGSGVRGTRAFFHFRGHGSSPISRSPGGSAADRTSDRTDAWTYDDLAAELRQVADGTGATRGVGVSLGAGALLRLLTHNPQRFDRVVIVLPASLDAPRPDHVVRRYLAAADLVERRDLAALAAELLGLQPRLARTNPDVLAWADRRARDLVDLPIAPVLRAFADQPPVSDRRPLAHVEVPVLVIGQEDDDVHPAGIARELAALLPNATLAVFPPGGLLWAHRHALRDQLAAFLNA
ncbi:alpha/beta fold hydrolase [Actinopolymorpha alba]|uniref:alpha/beta fold hydrolase n=1 Tax=Actinopolymorpha alba TaxID=533267 RepID=UPI000363CECC|nr:alpha/beta hydrolase [Actinopolymorpha alba]